MTQGQMFVYYFLFHPLRHIKNSPQFFLNLFIVLALDNTVEYQTLKPMWCVVMVQFLSKFQG